MKQKETYPIFNVIFYTVMVASAYWIYSTYTDRNPSKPKQVVQVKNETPKQSATPVVQKNSIVENKVHSTEVNLSCNRNDKPNILFQLSFDTDKTSGSYFNNPVKLANKTADAYMFASASNLHIKLDRNTLTHSVIYEGTVVAYGPCQVVQNNSKI